MEKGEFPFLYLGGPIFLGGTRVKYFDPLVNRIRHQLERWKSKLFSMTGRITLVRHVTNSIPIHIRLVYDLPKTTVKIIEKLMAGVYGEV